MPRGVRGVFSRWCVFTPTALLCVRLTTLNLSGNELTEEAVPPLLECLRGHPTLQQLMLDDNELENDGAEAIADFFATEASVHAPSSPLDWVLPGAVVVVWLC